MGSDDIAQRQRTEAEVETHRRRLEELIHQRTAQLEAANAQLQAVFDVVNVGMLLIDENGVVQRVNNTLSRWIGRDLSTFSGVQPGDFVGCVHAIADPAGCGKTSYCLSCPVRRAFESVLQSGQPVHDVETETTLVVDGNEVRLWLEVSVDPLVLDGKRHAILAMSNVTARKQAEEALRESQKDLNRAQAVARTGSWRLDVRRNELLWSDENHGIFGIPKGTPLTYEAFLDTVHPEDRAYVDQKWTAALHGEPYDIEHRIVVGDAVKWVRERAELEFDSQGVLLGGFGTTQDITDRKQTEEALRRIAEELARSNEDLGQFAYVASHDLQEPLRMVTGFLQLLQNKYGNQLDADADQFIEFAVDGARRMQTLINDLLAYSRVGTRARELAPTDSAAALQRALDNLLASIEETSAEITHSELPTVRADGTQLAQLFQNLIGNALKFRGETPPKIHVDARRNKDDWRFSVRDNGIGIAPESQDRIFLIFQRLHTRQQYPGTGIGLAICKKIVDRHGGRIWVESQPGQGATFCFTLPK